MSLNWNPKQPVTGKKKVELHRRLLLLIREMQRRDPKLPITFFDAEGTGTGKLQQLKELDLAYNELVNDGNIAEAGLLLETWLVVGRSGFSSVHQIRAVTQREEFVEDYLVPRLSEQDLFKDRVGALVRGERGKDSDLPGLDELGGVADSPDTTTFDLRPLLRLVEKTDSAKVILPGGDNIRVDGDELRGVLAEVISGAIADHKADNKAVDKLEAPVDALRKAVLELKRAISTYSELRDSKKFQETARKRFDYQYKQARKQIRKLDQLVADQEGSGPAGG